MKASPAEAMADGARLRGDALAILRAALGAVDPARLVSSFFARQPQSLSARGRVVIAAIGKAAPAMAGAAAAALGDRLDGGVLIAPKGGGADAGRELETFHGGHPVPDDEAVAGAGAVLDLASRLAEEDLLLCLISGGGSALMTLPPPGVSLDEVQSVTRGLLAAGATIAELNCVRKHLDRLKGGRLARAAFPGRVLALVLSDVVGDPLDVIASGPVSPDPTTYADAVAVLRRFGVWDAAAEAVRSHLLRGMGGELEETPKEGDPVFDRVVAHVVGHNRLAADAALVEASYRGYEGLLLSTLLTGEAREVGGVLGAMAAEMRRSNRPLSPPACLVAAGETTVTVRGHGRGGRNQELALGAAFSLRGLRDVLVASLGTDGVDGPTDAAGAFAAGDTLERASAAGLDARQALADNDAYPFFAALDDLIVTGPTGTNVMDLQLVLLAE